LESNPSLRPQYEAAVSRQKKIDAYRAAQRPVPESWISNPFHRAYYRAQGWLADAAAEPEDKS